jgi:hypothetical protein
MLWIRSTRSSTRRGILSAASGLAAGGLVVFSSARASAHFVLDAPACWMSQDPTGYPQKEGPCAATLSPNLEPASTPLDPTGAVTAFRTGQTVTVTVTATIPHPGWYRVSLVSGKSASQTLTTLPDPPQTVSTCTPTILTNPVWSPTQPVIADDLLGGAAAPMDKPQSFAVQLPANATCTAANPCTLQVIMVMTDHPANDCYYHHCADITIGAGADSGASGGADASVASDASSAHDASVAADAGHASSSSGSSSGSAGSSSSSSGGGATSSSSSSSGGGASSSSSGAGAASSSSSGGSAPGDDGGAAAPADDGGAAAPAGDGSSGGCGLAVGGGSPAAAGAAGFLMLAMARRRRRRS